MTEGVTPTERFLHRLARRSFLSLWSFPNLYRDQGIGARGEGAELCDLLVAFDNHVLIFSDKDCDFPIGADRDVAWRRWYRRAILKSAQQVWGAERWLREHPDRVFTDRRCTTPLPVSLPATDRVQFHRLVVAHDTSGRRRALIGGSGSLLVDPLLKGSDHLLSAEDGGHPFAVGNIDESRGFVHVLDDASIGIVLKTLDTITDFVKYLTRKELFLASGRLFGAFGEEDLLAFYLKHINEQTEDHDFVIPEGETPVLLQEGQWRNYDSRPEVHAKRLADRESYLWDSIIEEFAGHAVGGTLYWAGSTELSVTERILRILAREPRVRRRMLARSLLERVRSAPPPGEASFRSMLPSYAGDPHYVFVVVTPENGVAGDTAAYDEYRKRRRGILFGYCQAAMVHFTDAERIVGIATEGGVGRGRSHDICLIERTDWDEELSANARDIMARTGWFQSMRVSRGREDEYPKGPPRLGRHFSASVSKVGRNTPCPCGSGKKYKRCHGLQL